MANLKVYIQQKTYFENKGKIKNFADKQNQIETFDIRHVKGSSLGRKKSITDENLDLHKGMKNARVGKHSGKYKKYFVSF